jgi:hypothetical protein
MSGNVSNADDERKRRAKRSALLLGLLAIAIYVAFIVMSVRK